MTHFLISAFFFTRCPFEDPDDANPFSSSSPCPFHGVPHRRTGPEEGGRTVKVDRLYVVGGSFTESPMSKR